ncbi:MAG TPA: gfo/Idh/MocA family oxidoreductase, partial [Chitinophagaceae bacterium]|nr:gfo/Idh/MocA family oxidoreductase [Chitinophagaceae bacterium]
MDRTNVNRRNFLRYAATTATGMSLFPSLGEKILASTADTPKRENENLSEPIFDDPRIRFSVIGINHDHIYSQVDAVIRGGGHLISVFAKEPELIANFTKRYPQVKVAASENDILKDKSIQLICSAAIPIDRAGVGIRTMQNGKDYMSDKPGIISLEQLAEVRRIQKQTGRIYS